SGLGKLVVCCWPIGFVPVGTSTELSTRSHREEIRRGRAFWKFSWLRVSRPPPLPPDVPPPPPDVPPLPPGLEPLLVGLGLGVVGLLEGVEPEEELPPEVGALPEPPCPPWLPPPEA